jgi:hypothetical protein
VIGRNGWRGVEQRTGRNACPTKSTLFSTNDPGEKPLKGGLLVAKFGKGNYIYTSMVWYRQLRAGVPGAYRVFANMISYR